MLVMKNIIQSVFVFIFSIYLFTSCKKDDYIVGGQPQSTQVNVTTYDYLKSNSQGLFDSLVLIIDAAGIKDLVNQQNLTFFAPTDYSIDDYLSYRTKQEQITDPFRQWSFDSLMKYDLPKFADSMKVYFIDKALTFDQLTNDGAIYSTLHGSDKAVVSYEYATPDDPWYNPVLSVQPQVVHYTYLYQQLTPPIVATDISSDEGSRNVVQTSAIKTTTGMLNVLSNNHTLFFRQQ